MIFVGSQGVCGLCSSDAGQDRLVCAFKQDISRADMARGLMNYTK